jgi:hypothetical protein
MMENLIKKRMAIQLNVAQNDGNSSIFFWTLLPEHIIDLNQSDSGGTDVTVELTKGDKVTLPVTQKLDMIKKAIEICKQTDGLSD